MALQIWLPLNGDLHNQGLNRVIPTNNGAIINNAGKIGKCYSFGTAASDITLPATSMTNFTTEASVSFWIKILSWNTSYATFFQAGPASTAWTAYRFGILRNNANSNLCFTISNSSSSSGANYKTSNLELNTWYHLSFCYKIGHCLIYINGTLYKDYTTTIVPDFTGITTIKIGRCTNNSSYQTNCLLNDFRIYDHCLSDKEVDEISKGLVLHYQLNNNGLGGNNLLTGTNDFSEWYLNSRWSKNGKIATYSAGSKAWNDMDSPTISWSEVQGKTLTISAELRSDDFNYTDGSGFSICFVRKASGPAATGYSTRRLECTPIHLTKNQITTKWKKYSSTILNISDSSFTNTYNGGGGDWFGIYIWNYTNKSVQIKNIKLEIGNIATNYSPAPIDIGMNSNIIYDSSGYNNNGEIINTLSTEIPSPKNNISLHFSATNQKIKISGLSTTGFSNSYSFAWWEKINSVAPMHWGFSDGVRLNGMYTGRLWNTGDGSNNPLYNPGTTTQVAAPSVNIWHHWVMTGDGTKCRVYQDGILWAEAKTYKTITGTTIYINGWDTNTNYSSDNASISDFRIYATTLTADQIKELYETSKIIDGTNVKARDLEASI